MRILIDTTLLIEAERRRFDLASWGEDLEECWICDAGITEFMAGEPAKDVHQIRRFHETWESQISLLPSVGLTREICEQAGRLISAARRRGYPVNLGDGLHAAAAQSQGLTVATADTDHFRHLGVPCFNPLEQPSVQAST